MAKAIAVVVLYAMSVHSVPSVHKTFCKIFINNSAMIRAVARALIGGGCMFIYSCYARLISFEINPNNN